MPAKTKYSPQSENKKEIDEKLWVNVKERLPMKKGRYLTHPAGQYALNRCFQFLYFGQDKEWHGQDSESEIIYWLDLEIESPLIKQVRKWQKLKKKINEKEGIQPSIKKG